MTITAVFENSGVISNTEFSLTNNSTTLTPQTIVGAFQIWLDCRNMAAGDAYILKVYEKTKSGGVQGLVHSVDIRNARSAPVYVEPAFAFMWGWDFTLMKLQGTDRSFDWSIRKAA